MAVSWCGQKKIFAVYIIDSYEPLSMPMARPWRIVSWHFFGPMLRAIVSEAIPSSLRRIACSTAISQNGLILIFILASSIAVEIQKQKTEIAGLCWGQREQFRLQEKQCQSPII